MEQKAISVSQLSGYIKGIFDAEELLHNISIYGEISGLSISHGNAFFSLKDEDALLSCVFFGCDDANFKNGDLVTVTGTPRYYIKGGKLNFNVVKIAPFGIGELFKQFLETKEKLEREDLFDEASKKSIPLNVKRIGVVSSETGAVIQDIINVASRRNKGVDIILYPAKVQGDGSEKEIIDGIKFFDNYNVDVIIVARGGGSFEDLMPFNSEELARVVYKCGKPIISAVGHETDFTIIDFVSDLRAPTPSAAAELVVVSRQDKLSVINDTYKRITVALEQKISLSFNNLISLKKELENCVKNLLNDKEYSLNLLTQALNKLNPSKVLERGYAKIEKNGQNIASINEISLLDSLEIYLKDGKIETEVKNIIGKSDKRG